MNSILNFLTEIVNPAQAQVLAYLCGANLVLGVVAALIRGKFELVKLKEFGMRIIAVFGSYIGVSIAVKAIADFTALQTAIWVALIGYLTVQLITNVTELTGIKLPDSVMRFLEKPPDA